LCSKRQLSVQPFRQWPICGPRDLKARSGIQVRTANALTPKRRDRIKILLGRAGPRAEDGKIPPTGDMLVERPSPLEDPLHDIAKRSSHSSCKSHSGCKQFIQSSLFSLTSKTLWFWFNCVLPEVACTRIFRCVKTVTTIQRVFLPLVQLP
jgi:hypothetical protein